MAQVQVLVGSAIKRNTIIVEDTATPKEILIEAEIDFSMANVHLDGATLSTSEMNTSLKDHQVGEKAMLIAVVKDDNA